MGKNCEWEQIVNYHSKEAKPYKIPARCNKYQQLLPGSGRLYMWFDQMLANILLWWLPSTHTSRKMLSQPGTLWKISIPLHGNNFYFLSSTQLLKGEIRKNKEVNIGIQIFGNFKMSCFLFEILRPLIIKALAFLSSILIILLILLYM